MKTYKFKIVFLIITLFFPISNLFSQKLHSIYITDYEDSIFGTNNLEAETIMTTLAENTAEGLSYELAKAIYFNHATFNSSLILKTIKELVTTPEDIIIVFYFGRGVKNPNSKFPFLNLKDSKMPMEALANSVYAKNARLALIVSDCLDNKINKGIGYKGENRVTGIAKNLNSLQIKELFMQNTGLYIISSGKQNMPINFITDYREPKSVFISSFFNSYVTNTNRKDIIGIKNLSIESWINNTQERMNADINPTISSKIPQKIVVEQRPLKTTIPVISYPTFDYPYSFVALEKMLNQVIAQPNNKIRNEMLQNIIFCLDEKINVSKIKGSEILDTGKEIPVDQYFKTLLIKDPKLLSIKVLNNESNVDFPFETIRIEEKWN